MNENACLGQGATMAGWLVCEGCGHRGYSAAAAQLAREGARCVMCGGRQILEREPVDDAATDRNGPGDARNINP
jgi:hypothetical protein